jgi:hypothetical protein
MSNKMKITGVAPLIAGPTFVYLIITAIISYLTKPFFSIIESDSVVLIYLGVALILLGVIMVAACGRRLLKSLKLYFITVKRIFVFSFASMICGILDGSTKYSPTFKRLEVPFTFRSIVPSRT